MSFVLAKLPIRSLVISAIAGVGATVAVLGTSMPAAAQIVGGPWCLNIDGTKQCTFLSLSQCLATASGREGQCDANSTYGAYAQYGYGTRYIR